MIRQIKDKSIKIYIYDNQLFMFINVDKSH